MNWPDYFAHPFPKLTAPLKGKPEPHKPVTRGISLQELEFWHNEINDLIHLLDDDGSGLLTKLRDLRDDIYHHLY